MTENVPVLIRELYTWESQTKWWPNKHLWQRALVALGEQDQWGVGTMDSNEAHALYRSKGKRDKPRWKRIYDALYEAAAAELQKPENMFKGKPSYADTAKMANELKKAEVGIGNAKILYLDRMKVSELVAGHAVSILGYDYIKPDHWTLNALIKGAHTPDTDPRAVATLKREIKNKDELIAKQKREYEDLLNQGFCGNDVKETLNKEITRLRAENIRQQEKAQKYYALYEDATYKLDSTPDSDDVQKLEQQVHDLSVKLHEANNKQASKMIDFQTAISGLMSGRVLEPEMKTQISLADDDLLDLEIFKDVWTEMRENLPDIHVYGMKNKESGICKRHGITIDDYGQPTAPLHAQDFARTLMYMDNAIAHAHQELQAAARVADILIQMDDKHLGGA